MTSVEEDSTKMGITRPAKLEYLEQRRTVTCDNYTDVLKEIHQRANNTDSVNTDLQRRLKAKNRELLENSSVLEKSKDLITHLQLQLDSERKQNKATHQEVRQMAKDRMEMSVQLETKDEELRGLRFTVDDLRKELSWKDTAITQAEMERKTSMKKVWAHKPQHGTVLFNLIMVSLECMYPFCLLRTTLSLPVQDDEVCNLVSMQGNFVGAQKKMGL